MFRAALTYHPNIGTFRGQRGAWRVFSCFDAGAAPLGIRVGTDGDTKYLWMDVPRKLIRHTFVNPTKLLRQFETLIQVAREFNEVFDTCHFTEKE